MLDALDRALQLAASQALSTPPPTIADVTKAANAFFLLLAGQETGRTATAMTIAVGTPTTQKAGIPVQLHDNEQVVLTISETDAKGVPVTADTLTWSTSDPTIATVTVDPTTTYSATIVAGTVGSAVITVSDGTLSATEAIDVIPGPVAAITIGEGVPVPQP